MIDVPYEEDDMADVAAAWMLALAKALGTQLASAAGSYIWGEVKREVLGDTGLPSYYEQVYAEIRNILHEKFDEHYLKEIRDYTSLFEQKIDHYNNMGRSEDDFNNLKNTSFDMITKANSLGSPGAFHYVEATVLHTMMLREDYKRMQEAGFSPDDLAKARDYIARRVRGYADNIMTKRINLINERLAKINTEPFRNYSIFLNPQPGRVIAGIREGGYRHDAFRYDPVSAPSNRFNDHANGFFVSMFFHWLTEATNPGHSWKWVNERLLRYRRHIQDHTDNSTHAMHEVAESLRKIASEVERAN